MKTTKTFLFATIDMILRYIEEMNEHDSPVSHFQQELCIQNLVK